MFTGLVKEVGTIKSVLPNKEGQIIEVASTTLLSEIKTDDSVSINGVCQTVIRVSNNTFKVQAVKATLEKTTLSKIREGEKVNLELALRLSDRLGGHIVQGHVNGTSVIKKIIKNGNNYLLSAVLPDDLQQYVVKEGSITIDGISLTVYELNQRGEFTISIIPHTWFNTIFQHKSVGELINIEVDVLAKYVEKLLGKRESESAITAEWLISKGF